MTDDDNGNPITTKGERTDVGLSPEQRKKKKEEKGSCEKLSIIR